MRDPEVLGERVVALRRLFRYTQGQFAEKVGTSQGTVSKMEHATTTIDESLLRHMSDCLHVPVSFFDADPIGISEGSLRFRKRSTARLTEAKQVVQFTVEAYRACSFLAAASALPSPSLPRATSSELDADDIERLASETRSALDVGTEGPVPHVTRACERAGVFVLPIVPPGGPPDERDIGHAGVSTVRSLPGDPAVIGYLPSMPGDRQRHTVAHELGHLVLHANRPAVADAEQEAHRFASAFLMPRERALEAFGAAGSLTLDKFKLLKAGWGMAVQSLVMRAWYLDVIDDDRRTSLYKQLSGRGWRRNEPVKVHNEYPVLLHKVLVRRYGDPIDWNTAAGEIGLPVSMLQEMAPIAPSR